MDQNTISDVFVSKFELGGSTLYASVLWKPSEDDLFHIKIYDDGTTWTGKYNNNLVESNRERIDETEEEYLVNVKNALAGDQTQYTYKLITVGDGSDKTITFQWIKKYADGGVKHGSVQVLRDDIPVSKDELINILLSQNNYHIRTIQRLNRKNEQINEDLNKCKNELEEFANMKLSLEKCLYGKFVHLLNAKKRRIQLLEENLHTIAETNKNS